jgi:hypothetical protein
VLRFNPFHLYCCSILLLCSLVFIAHVVGRKLVGVAPRPTSICSRERWYNKILRSLPVVSFSQIPLTAVTCRVCLWAFVLAFSSHPVGRKLVGVAPQPTSICSRERWYNKILRSLPVVSFSQIPLTAITCRVCLLAFVLAFWAHPVGRKLVGVAPQPTSICSRERWYNKILRSLLSPRSVKSI